MIVLLLALAGGLGAVARYTVDTEVKAWLAAGRTARRGALPWATLAINVSGSLLLGVIAGVVLRGGPSEVEAVIGTGFCGGYTTFSTASVETVRLVQAGRHRAALVNAVGTVVLSIGACAVGFAITRAV